MISFREYDIIRSITRKSFYEFVKEFWPIVVQNEPLQSNWHIKYLCWDAQREVERRLARKKKRYDYIIYNIPPVSLKSTIFAMFLHGWIWARNPSMNFIGCSYEQNLMVGHARKARDLIRSEKYKDCFPEVVIRGDMNAVGTYGTKAGGVRYSAGTQGSITGKHGDLVVIDDPLNPRAARSIAETKAVKEFILEALPSRKRSIDLVPTILIMQRLSQEDPTGFLLDMAERGEIRVKHVCLPATLSPLVKPASLKKYYYDQDKMLNPKRLGRAALRELKASGDFMYAGQYDQSPVPVGGGMFQANKLIVKSPPDPTNPRKWVKQIRYWDKAATYDDGCWTVGLRLGKDLDGNWCILHVDRFRLESRARENRIRQRAELDGKHVVVGIEQEPGGSGKGDAQATMRNLAGWRIVADRPTGSKELRADPVASQVNGGNMYLAPEGYIDGLPEAWHAPFIGEIQYFPFSKFKDQVDALSGAFGQTCQGTFQIGFNNL